MKIKDLIKELKEYPEDANVNIFDWRKNLNEDWGDGSSAGVYPLELEFFTLGKDEEEHYNENHDVKFKPWLGIIFNNEDYNDDGVNLHEE